MPKKPGQVLDIRNIEQLPGSLFNSTAVHPDPARAWPGAPPEFGLIKPDHIATMGGWMGSQARTYPNEDEATRHSRANSEMMRRDGVIAECLGARERAVSLLPWHLQPEDDDDPRQKQLVADLTSILERTRRFTELRRNLMEAIWYGKSFVQLKYWPAQVKGKWRKIVTDWEPRHPDKIVFRYSDGTPKYMAGQVGIRVSYQARNIRKEQVESTQYGLAYFLRDHERRVCIVHKHEIEDGVYEDVWTAGRIHGVGVRDRVYWLWYAAKEVEQKLLEYLDRTALGIEIWRYPSGNNQAEAAARSAATERIGGGRSIVLVPVIPGEQAELFGVQHIEPGPAGAELLNDICQNFYGHRIKRIILGQTLTSEAEATGMGSGVADAHMATFGDIVKYDSVNLAETLTEDMVRIVKEENFPWARSVYVKLVISTGNQEMERDLGAAERAWNMGLKLRADDLYKMIGATRPDDEDDVLQNPNIAMAEQQLAMQAAQMGMQQAGQDQNRPGCPTVFPPMGQDGQALDDVQAAAAAQGQPGAQPGQPPLEVSREAAGEPGAQLVNPWAGFWDSLFAAARGQGVQPPSQPTEAAMPMYRDPLAPQTDTTAVAREFHRAFQAAIAKGQTAAQFRDALESALDSQPDVDQLRATMQFLFAWKTKEPVMLAKAALKDAFTDALDVHSAVNPADSVKQAVLDAYERRANLRGQLARALTEAEPEQYAADATDATERVVHPVGTPEYDRELLRWHKDAHPSLKDRTGKPKTLYHGTTSDFDEFDPDADAENDWEDAGIGSWFSSGPSEAGYFTKEQTDLLGSRSDKHANDAALMPVHLNLKNPKVFENQRDYLAALRDTDYHRNGSGYALRQQLLREGHDGIHIQESELDGRDNPSASWYVAFHPHQVKSATANRGTFSPDDPRINYHQPGQPDKYAQQGAKGIRGSSTDGNPVPPQDPQAKEIPLVEADRPSLPVEQYSQSSESDSTPPDPATILSRYRAGEITAEEVERLAMEVSLGGGVA